jgi:hypothetical protein
MCYTRVVLERYTSHRRRVFTMELFPVVCRAYYFLKPDRVTLTHVAVIHTGPFLCKGKP